MHLGVNSIVGADKTVLYPTAWATRLENTHTLSLICKAIPFTYKRGCTLS